MLVLATLLKGIDLGPPAPISACDPLPRGASERARPTLKSVGFAELDRRVANSPQPKCFSQQLISGSLVVVGLSDGSGHYAANRGLAPRRDGCSTALPSGALTLTSRHYRLERREQPSCGARRSSCRGRRRRAGRPVVVPCHLDVVPAAEWRRQPRTTVARSAVPAGASPASLSCRTFPTALGSPGSLHLQSVSAVPNHPSSWVGAGGVTVERLFRRRPCCRFGQFHTASPPSFPRQSMSL